MRRESTTSHGPTVAWDCSTMTTNNIVIVIVIVIKIEIGLIILVSIH